MLWSVGPQGISVGPHMKASWIAAFGGLALCPGVVRADVSTPGFKLPALLVAIDNLGDYPDYHFYLVPSEWLEPTHQQTGPGRGDRPHGHVMPGEFYGPGYPARFLHQWTLVAVPRQRAEVSGEASWELLMASERGVFHSNPVDLFEPRSVLLFNPKDYEVHHFRVEISDGRLSLTPGQVEQGSNGFSSWLPAILGVLVVAAIVGLGLWGVRRWRARNRIPAP